MTTPRRTSLLLIAGTDLCAAVAALAILPAITVIAGLPIAFYAPGAALLLAIDPHKRHVRGAQRVMWTVAGSIGTVIAGGLLLNVIGGLTRTSWLLFLTIDVLILCIVGWVRGASPDDLDVPDGSNSIPTATDMSFLDPDASSEDEEPRKPVGLRQIALLIATAGVVAVALVLSIHSSAVASRESFVQAWILTQPANDKWSTSAQFGLTNHEGERKRLIVDIAIGHSATQEKTITLDDGQTWHLGIRRKGGEPVQVSVFTDTHVRQPLASVSLAQPVVAHPKAKSGSTPTTTSTTTTKPAAVASTTSTTSK